MGMPTKPVMTDAEREVYAEIRRIVRGESPHADLTEALPDIRLRVRLRRAGWRDEDIAVARVGQVNDDYRIHGGDCQCCERTPLSGFFVTSVD